MKPTTLILLLLASLSTHAVTWHVDPSYPGETGNGLSWDSPWNTTASINWSAVRAGDVIELATGDFGDESLAVGRSGTASNPIIVRLATDPLRRGNVQLRAISVSNNSWITIDGSLDKNFVPPASVHGIAQIANNIGIHVRNAKGPGVYMSGSSTGNRILWVETFRCGEFTSGQKHGIHINGDTRLAEIGYCWIREQHYGDGINRGSGIQPNRFDDLTVHDTIITQAGDDGMQIGGGGADIYRCMLDGFVNGGRGGHPDAFQTWGSYYRIHHNIVRDYAAGENYYASLAYAQMSNPENGHFYLYNNLFINEDKPNETGFMFSIDAWFSPNKHNTNVVITNLFVANNLWHIWKGTAVGHTFYYESDRYRGTNDYYTITNCFFINNAVIGCQDENETANAVSISSTNLQPSNISYGAWMFDHNVVAGPSSRIRYMGGDVWNNAEELNAAGPYKNNSSALPAFVAYAPRTPAYDFHLLSGDTVSLGRGTNLTAWLTNAPMVNVDLDGRERGETGAWDIGPYQSGPATEACSSLRRLYNEALATIRSLIPAEPGTPTPPMAP